MVEIGVSLYEAKLLLSRRCLPLLGLDTMLFQTGGVTYQVSIKRFEVIASYI